MRDAIYSVLPFRVIGMAVRPTASSASLPTRARETTGIELLIDFEKLLDRIGRNADLLRDLVSLFLSTQPKDMKSLRQAIDAGELERSKRLAHRMAGSFASMAMEILARRALDIERHAAAADLDACKADVSELETRFEIVIREMAGALGRMMDTPANTALPPAK